MIEILDILKKLQKGYTKKDPKNAPALMSEIFSNRQDLLTLGTGTGEICLGRDEVEELIRSDWDGGWGDFVMDLENAKIEQEGDIAWFFADCTVGYFYEDTPENYAYFADVARELASNEKATPKQRLSHINWLLGIRFHQRADGRREYLMPVKLSGMLIKEENYWKIATLHFSQEDPSYPDMRFEDYNSDFVDMFENQKSKFISHAQNVADPKVIQLLNDFKDEGIEFDARQVKIFESGDFAWVMAIGIQKKTMSEDEVLHNAIQEITKSFDDGISPEKRLFEMKHNVAYALKEISSGAEFTWQIRLSAVIEKAEEGYKIRHKHLSYPCDCIIEGKL